MQTNQDFFCVCGELTHDAYYKKIQANKRQKHHAPTKQRSGDCQDLMKVCSKCKARYSICKIHEKLGFQPWKLQERSRMKRKTKLWIYACKECNPARLNSTVLCPGCKAPFVYKGPKWYLRLQNKCTLAITRKNCRKKIGEQIKKLASLGESSEDIFKNILKGLELASMPKAASPKPDPSWTEFSVKPAGNKLLRTQRKLELISSTPKAASPKTEPSWTEFPVNFAAKPSVYRASAMNAEMKAIKVACEPSNLPKRLKTEPDATSETSELDSSFLSILDNVFTTDFDVSGEFDGCTFDDCNSGEASMFSFQDVDSSCMFESYIAGNAQHIDDPMQQTSIGFGEFGDYEQSNGQTIATEDGDSELHSLLRGEKLIP